MAFLTWLGTFSLAPALMIAGAVAVLSPIIIHLLNKRKFKIVDWAAMDFLLDADKRNRRRVRLENLILLLLRCAAIFLLGLLLAQPFIPSQFALKLLGASKLQHIFVLDDSLSMQVQSTGTQSPFEDAKERLIQLLNEFARDRNDDSFTLILSSAPDQTVINGERVTETSIGQLIESIKALEPSDLSADLEKTLATVERDIGAQADSVNRVVYLVTDLRRRDWTREKNVETESDPARILKRIADKLKGGYVIDVGAEGYKNLAITGIRPQGVLVAGVISSFVVDVSNFGSLEAKELVVKFKAGDTVPQEVTIESILPGKTESRIFSYTFTGDAPGSEEESKKLPLEPTRVVVEVVSTQPAEEDRLLADSTAFFPARVIRGVPVLIVDGDPSSDPWKSESIFLRNSLRPRADNPSGVVPEIVHEAEMETVSFAKYDVIFLCNIYQLSEKVRKDLEDWVSRGGGLVIMPGDQVDERAFNELYFKDGKGLSPLKLVGIKGDETGEKFVNFKVEDSKYPILKTILDDSSEGLDAAKVFRWWHAEVAKGNAGTEVKIPLRFNDPDNSIAIAEKKFGAGTVCCFSFPGDLDWANWPIEPTFVVAMQDTVRHLLDQETENGNLQTGQPLVQSIDLTDYKTDAELKLPKDKKVGLLAREPVAPAAANANEKKDDKEKAAGKEEDKPKDPAPPMTPMAEVKGPMATRWQLEYDATDRRGFYELTLKHTDDVKEKILFAVNAHPTEGDLTRADQAELRKTFGDSVKIVSGVGGGSLSSPGAEREIWKWILLAALAVLSGEMVLAWIFGLRR